MAADHYELLHRLRRYEQYGHFSEVAPMPGFCVYPTQIKVYTRFMSDCYCAALRTATRKISAAYDDALAPAGINVGQYSLLRCVQKRGSVSLTDLGHDLELDRTTISRNVRVLQKDGLVMIMRGEADKREALVALSPNGQACLARAIPLWSGCQQTMESRLGSIKVTALQEILRSL